MSKLIEFLMALLMALSVGVPSCTPQPWVECGCCGAHVTEWWYVRNMDDTAFVEVCEDCYKCFKYEGYEG